MFPVNSHQAPITAGHYGFLRILLGCYLCIHFLHLLPYGSELFSDQGVLPSEYSPLMGIIPNPLLNYDSPAVVSLLLSLGAIFGISIAFGMYDRLSSLFIVIILGWLFARNPLIANPSLPVIGWMLVAHVFIPVNAYGRWSTRSQPGSWVNWFYPNQIFVAAWVLLAIAYSYSGYTKLLSPSWVDGTAITLVLENPLARDHFVNSILLSAPPVMLKLLTWAVIAIELFFVLFCFLEVTRKWAWFAMLLIQFGFLVFLDFADLTFPMLLIHMLTFDRRWLTKHQPSTNAILFYDGTCAFCNGLVQFSLSEDKGDKLRYSALQGQTFIDKKLTTPAADSIVMLDDSGMIYYKSDAAVYCLKMLGGIWLVLGFAINVIPKIIRDAAYDLVGVIRYRIAGKIETEVCQLLPPSYRQRILP